MMECRVENKSPILNIISSHLIPILGLSFKYKIKYKIYNIHKLLISNILFFKVFLSCTLEGWSTVMIDL